MTPLLCPFSKNQSAQTVNALVEFLYNIHFFSWPLHIDNYPVLLQKLKIAEEKVRGSLGKGAVKNGNSADASDTQDSGKMNWYFVTKIVLTYCEKKLF